MGDAEKEGTKRKKETGVGGNVNECVCVCVCVCVCTRAPVCEWSQCVLGCHKIRRF